ncbi:zinc ribbon domain-containing protein [Streptomyces sp. NPDC059455]|uniref:zinc ribbon domain-containing protein n=1 Tax=Streptomyces sp. NPDC059455 TaxID=3346837 RepID=UPI0036C0314C
MERLPARPQGSARGGGAVCEVGGSFPASHHRGQAHRGTGLARRRVSGRPSTVPSGPRYRLQELLRLAQGHAAGPEGRAAPVQVEERHPAVDPPQHQCLLTPGERNGVRGQGCGFRDAPKPLRVREWTCGGCGTVHDRDHNAARNVLFEGRRIVAAGRAETLNASWSAGKTRAKVPAQRVEAGSPRKGQTTRAGIPGL